MAVNSEELVKRKLFICREYHIQPSEIDRMRYYEYEIILEEIMKNQKEQEKEQEKQHKQYDSMTNNLNPASFGKNISNMASNYKMPSMSSIQMPKI